jgi:hypothetical protein
VSIERLGPSERLLLRELCLGGAELDAFDVYVRYGFSAGEIASAIVVLQSLGVLGESESRLKLTSFGREFGFRNALRIWSKTDLPSWKIVPTKMRSDFGSSMLYCPQGMRRNSSFSVGD